MFETTILAVLQGIAEFLPISSSGHLVIFKHLLGLGETGMRLDVFLHVGTLLAVFLFYAKTVARLFGGCFLRKGPEAAKASWGYVGKIVLSAVPAGIVGVLFKDELEAAFTNPKFVGAALVFTGLVLTATRFLPKGTKDVSVWKALLMGLAQAVAILPGVSRSGMTLAAARAAKVDAEKSAEFSFLMSAPPIAGAALLDVLKMLKGASEVGAPVETPWGLVLVGAAIAAVVGYFALTFLVKSLQGRWFWLFGPYCLAAGLLTLILI